MATVMLSRCDRGSHILLHGRDGIYCDTFHDEIRAMGLREILSGRRSPWQNPFVERVVGSIRRECTDHIIAMGERLLASRCHRSLDGNSPVPRQHESTPVEVVIAVLVLGGLHHQYRRAA